MKEAKKKLGIFPIEPYYKQVRDILASIPFQKYRKNGKELKFWKEYREDPVFHDAVMNIQHTAEVKITDYMYSNNLNVRPDEIRELSKLPKKLMRPLLKRTVELNDYQRAKKEFPEAGEWLRQDYIAKLMKEQQKEENKKKARILLFLRIENNSKFVRMKSKARQDIENYVLQQYNMKKSTNGRPEYELTIPYSSDEGLDKIIEDIGREIWLTADDRNCFIEADFSDMESGRRW